MHICMGEVLLWDIEFRVQGAGGVQGELVIRGIVKKHDCTLPTLHPKHSNARGALIRVRVRPLVSSRRSKPIARPMPSGQGQG